MMLLLKASPLRQPTRFGSGWAWLVVNQEGNLEVTSSANQDNPLLEGKKPFFA